MAELSDDCCTERARKTCCDPSEKAHCCGAPHAAGCGCTAGKVQAGEPPKAKKLVQ